MNRDGFPLHERFSQPPETQQERIAALFREQELVRRQLRLNALAKNMSMLEGEAVPPPAVEAQALKRVYQAQQIELAARVQAGLDALWLKWNTLSLFKRLLHAIKGTLP